MSLSPLLVAVGSGCAGIVPRTLLGPMAQRARSQLVAGTGHHWAAVLGSLRDRKRHGRGEC